MTDGRTLVADARKGAETSRLHAWEASMMLVEIRALRDEIERMRG